MSEGAGDGADIRNRGVPDGEEDIQDIHEEEAALSPHRAETNSGANDSSVQQVYFSLLICVQMIVVRFFLQLTQQNKQLQNIRNESWQQLKDITEEFRKQNCEHFRQIRKENREQFRQIQKENQQQFRQIRQENHEQFREIQKDNRKELQELHQKRDEFVEYSNSAEDRISDRVVEKLVNSEQFQRMVQCQHQTSPQADIIGKHMQRTPSSPECRRCHLLDVNKQWKKEKRFDRENSRSWNSNVQLSQERIKRDIDWKEREEGNTRHQEQIVASGLGGPSIDPDSGSSSEEEYSKYGQKRNKICHSKERNSDNKERDRKILASKIDAGGWKRCIEKKDVEEALQDARRLLKERVLPNQDVLDRASDIFKNSPKIIQDICTDICSHIEKASSNIIRVWAARDHRKNQDTVNRITFVVFTKGSKKIETYGYRCYQRCVNEISKHCAAENTDVRKREQNCSKNYSETERVKECLNKHSKSLMENHTNITRISLSWFKSKGFKKGKRPVTRKTCIAVYVQAKGLIPINESALPEMIEGIDIDVRESVVMPYALPNEYHEHLKIGCAVHGKLRLCGTLGGFLEKDGKMFCISCAHVFLSNDDMLKLKPYGIATGDHLFDAYQSASPVSGYFGRGICAAYREGGNGEPGVEAVLIQIDKRLPLSGDFPDCPRRNPGFGSLRSFSSGKICSREEVNRLVKDNKLTVVKFGCGSGWTRGRLRFEFGSVRFSKMYGTLGDLQLILHNQFEIEDFDETHFAEQGDSGALVFTVENDELAVIGMVEAGDNNVSFVTPICEIFAALGQGINKMKEFTGNHSSILTDPSAAHHISVRTPEESPRVTNRSDSGFCAVDEPSNSEIKFKILEQRVAEQFRNNEHATQQLVRAAMLPVRAELNTLVKSEAEASKTELKTDIESIKCQMDALQNKLEGQMVAMQNQFEGQLQRQTDSIKSMLSELLSPRPVANTPGPTSS